MAMNVGKIFENQFKKSIPEDVMYFRIPDPAQSFEKVAKFSHKPPFDCFMFYGGTLFCLELKTTKSKSFTIERTKDDKGMIHFHQIENLREYSKYNGIVSGLICNFRIEDKDLELTYFISIENYDKMLSKIGDKKSFSMIDMINNGAVKIESVKKRVHYMYDVGSFIKSMAFENN